MVNLFTQNIEAQIDNICLQLLTLPIDDRVEMLNAIRTKLHEVSPFRGEPVDLVLWEKSENVIRNDYNPNTVAPPEMRLLQRSITEDGYTQPIVGFEDGEKIEVVDGFHRHRVGKECKAVRLRVHGYLPVTKIRSDRTDKKHRIAATIRHNRARGVHGVEPMADIVASLVRQGWTDTEVSQELGMSADEVLRFKQNLGLAELFKDHSFNSSWT